MLTKLLPEQVSKFWDVIKFGLEESLPPIVGGHPDRMNRILTALLTDKAICWASYKREKTVKFEGIAVTRILYDDVSNTRNLLIYAVYGYETVDRQTWLEGITALAKYASSKRCDAIIAYTDLPHIVEIVRDLGGDTATTFLSFNVKQIVQILNGLEV
jgi:hypothetical protein